MSYVIKKAAHVQDEVKIQDGEKELTVSVNIYVDQVMGSFEKYRRQIGAAQKNIQDITKSDKVPEDKVAEAYAALGEAVVAFFSLLFGEEQTQKILDFYDGRSASMLADFIPYITEKIVPEVQKAQKEVAARYTSWKH